MTTLDPADQANRGHFKDEILDRLAVEGNVAQFVSFSPQGQVRRSRVSGFQPNHQFPDRHTAIESLLSRSPEGMVNVRSFAPYGDRCLDFEYGIKSLHQVVSKVDSLGSMGLFAIVNETVDVSDGGVSGVSFGGIVECAPGKTPRCVEGPGCMNLSLDMTSRVLHTIYKFPFIIPAGDGRRIEFSVHPLPRGYRKSHVILWESEQLESFSLDARLAWPHDLSRIVGDKAFGLIMADASGLPVPRTHVFARGLPDFEFGRSTGTGITWLRTCPREQVPGKFTTVRGWIDPFKLMHTEDPDGSMIASIISQEGVESEFSGALVTMADGEVVIEGVSGTGERFMQGSVAPEVLPHSVRAAVGDLYAAARAVLGPVRMEWAFDGSTAWVVQLHAGLSVSQGATVYPGSPESWVRMPVSYGIAALRAYINDARTRGAGIVLEGQVGLTSHMADLLRKARVPSRIEP